MTEQAAQHLLPSAPRQDQLRLARFFDHRALKESCEWIAGRRGNPPTHARDLIRNLQGTAIADVAAAFCDLQEARHQADYDHLASFSKAATLLYIQDAQQAISKLTTAIPSEREAFFALVALRTSLR
jgi:hypothetical protein